MRVIYRAGNWRDDMRMTPRTVEETRLLNARRLAEENPGGITGMARRLQKSQSQWQNTIGKTPIKNIGSDVAREIEKEYSKPAGWMDMPWDMLSETQQRLTKEGSTEPASGALLERRDPNDVEALQWISGAIVAHLFASQPDAAAELIASLGALPKAYQETGPGGALLEQLEKLSARVSSAKGRQASGRRGTPPSSRRSRS